MELNIVLLTDRNLGDHGEMTRRAYHADPDETIAQLVDRIALDAGPYRKKPGERRELAPGDVVEIRQIGASQ